MSHSNARRCSLILLTFVIGSRFSIWYLIRRVRRGAPGSFSMAAVWVLLLFFVVLTWCFSPTFLVDALRCSSVLALSVLSEIHIALAPPDDLVIGGYSICSRLVALYHRGGTIVCALTNGLPRFLYSVAIPYLGIDIQMPRHCPVPPLLKPTRCLVGGPV